MVNIYPFLVFQLAITTMPKTTISSYKSGTSPNRLKFFNFLHKAREEFMDSENLERFSRALNHNIWT